MSRLDPNLNSAGGSYDGTISTLSTMDDIPQQSPKIILPSPHETGQISFTGMLYIHNSLSSIHFLCLLEGTHDVR